MAAYKVSVTVYKDPAGKTLMGPTALHFLGDLCSAVGLMGIIMSILAVMDDYGTMALIVGIITAVAGFALCVVLHKLAKKRAQAKFLEVLAKLEGQTMSSERSN